MDCDKDLLLKNAKSGDKAALVQLALTHSPDVYRLALYLLRSEEEAQDAAADTFSKLYAVPNQIPWEYFRSWLFGELTETVLNGRIIAPALVLLIMGMVVAQVKLILGGRINV